MSSLGWTIARIGGVSESSDAGESWKRGASSPVEDRQRGARPIERLVEAQPLGLELTHLDRLQAEVHAGRVAGVQPGADDPFKLHRLLDVAVEKRDSSRQCRALDIGSGDIGLDDEHGRFAVELGRAQPVARRATLRPPGAEQIEVE